MCLQVCECVFYIYMKLCVCLFCDASFKKKKQIHEKNVAFSTWNEKIECVFGIYVQENLRGICNLSRDISL